MFWTLDKILNAARKFGASDVHLIRGFAPAFRVNGEIRLIEGEALDEDSLRAMIDGLMNEKHREIFAREWQLCFSRHWEGVGRFRASVYLHAGVPEMAIRLCETSVRGRDDLGLPPVIDDFARLPNGLILITGATGNGKTTTLNYLVDLINRSRRAKIVTIEDPVEYVHHNQSSIVVQQEVFTDVPSFRQALTHVLRQDPDVVVIGEMRDLETVATALTAAETGHLVLATLHTPDAVQTIQRIFSVFPHEQQNNIMYQLANTLQACSRSVSCLGPTARDWCLPARSASRRPPCASESARASPIFSSARCRWAESTKCRRWTAHCWNSTSAAT